jgi:hypothetical protein
MARITPDALSRAMFAVSENIARGSGCTMCGATWDRHHLNHRPGCAYLAYLDLIDPLEAS